MDEETIGLVEDYIDGKLELFDEHYSELPYAKREAIGRTVDHSAGRNRYIGYLISLGMYSFKGMRVGLDCANGASWNIARSVFEALGAKTYVINADPDGYNINTNAGSTHIEGLQKFVLDNGLDVGFAYDGDADRCLCVDEKGNIVSGDHILYIYGRYMKERGKLLMNTVVTTVMSNFGLYKAFDELGIDYAKTAVGDKYVYEYMMQHGCRIGGEQSGHIIFSKYASTGDGILTSLKIMEVMMAKKKPLSELHKDLTIYPQVLKNVRVTDKRIAQAMEVRTAGRDTPEGAELVKKYQFVNKYEPGAILYRNTLGDTLDLHFFAVAFGDVAISGVPFEQFDTNGQEVRAASPFPVTFTLSITNDHNGYVPSALAFPHGAYEVGQTKFVEGSAEEFVREQIRLLNECKNAA